MSFPTYHPCFTFLQLQLLRKRRAAWLREMLRNQAHKPICLN